MLAAKARVKPPPMPADPKVIHEIEEKEVQQIISKDAQAGASAILERAKANKAAAEAAEAAALAADQEAHVAATGGTAEENKPEL